MSEIKTHSKLGASNAKRWFECPGSVELCELMPKQPDSAASIEGTNAHSLMELVLKNPGPNAYWYMGRESKHGLDFKIPSEMAGFVQSFCDRVIWTKNQLPGSTMFVEKRFHLKHIHPDLYGTADVVIVQPFGKIYVIDFKYGAGIRVDVIENPQLLYYGLGATYNEDFSDITLVVAQPRIEGQDWNEWDTSPEYMVEFSKILKQKAIATQKKDAPLNAGEWCQFCAAASICPKLQTKALASAQADFREESPNLPVAVGMTDEQISRVIENEKMIMKWIKSVKEAAFLKLMSGHKIEGLKLVRGKGSRDWNIDELEIVEKFGKKVMLPAKVMSFPQAEKVLGKKTIAQYCQNIPGNMDVTHESDKRSEVISAGDDFEKIENTFGIEDF